MHYASGTILGCTSPQNGTSIYIYIYINIRKLAGFAVQIIQANPRSQIVFLEEQSFVDYRAPILNITYPKPLIRVQKINTGIHPKSPSPFPKSPPPRCSATFYPATLIFKICHGHFSNITGHFFFRKYHGYFKK